MVKKIVNPNIIRITNNEDWKSKYFEKKASDLSSYSIRDTKIRSFIHKFFKNNGMTVNSCELYHKNKSIDIVLSYWKNPESIYMINKTREVNKVVLKKPNDEDYENYEDDSYLKIVSKLVKKKLSISQKKKLLNLPQKRKIKDLLFELKKLKKEVYFTLRRKNKIIALIRNIFNNVISINKLHLKRAVQISIEKFVKKAAVGKKSKGFAKIIYLKCKNKRRCLSIIEKKQAEKFKNLKKKYLKYVKKKTFRVSVIKEELKLVRLEAIKMLKGKQLKNLFDKQFYVGLLKPAEKNQEPLKFKVVDSIKNKLSILKDNIIVLIKKKRAQGCAEEAKKVSHKILASKMNRIKVKQLRQIIFKREVVKRVQTHLQSAKISDKNVKFITKIISNVPKTEFKKVINHCLDDYKIDYITKHLQRNFLIHLALKPFRKYSFCYYKNPKRKNHLNAAYLVMYYIKSVKKHAVNYLLMLKHFFSQNFKKTLNSYKDIKNSISFFAKKDWLNLKRKTQKHLFLKKKVQNYIKVIKNMVSLKKKIKKKIYTIKKIKKFLIFVKNIENESKQLNVLFEHIKLKNQANTNLADAYEKMHRCFLKLKKIKSFKFVKLFHSSLLKNYAIKEKIQIFWECLKKLEKIFSYNKVNLNAVNCLKSIKKEAFSILSSLTEPIKLSKVCFKSIKKNFNRKSQRHVTTIKYIYAHCFVKSFIKENTYVLKQRKKCFMEYVKNTSSKHLYAKWFHTLQRQLKKQIAGYIKKSFKNTTVATKPFYAVKFNNPQKRMQIKRGKLDKTKVFSINNRSMDFLLKKMSNHLNMRTEDFKNVNAYSVPWLKLSMLRKIEKLREKEPRRAYKKWVKRLLRIGRRRLFRRRNNIYYKTFRRTIRECRYFFQTEVFLIPLFRGKKRRRRPKQIKVKRNCKKILEERKKIRVVLKKAERGQIKKIDFKNLFSLKTRAEQLLKKKSYLKTPVKFKRNLRNIGKELTEHFYPYILHQKKAIKKYKLRFEYLTVIGTRNKTKYKKRKGWIWFQIKKRLRSLKLFKPEKSYKQKYKQLLKKWVGYKKFLKFLKRFSEKNVMKNYSHDILYKTISELQTKIMKNEKEIVSCHRKYKKFWEYIRKFRKRLLTTKRFKNPYRRKFPAADEYEHIKKIKKELFKKFASSLKKNLEFFFLKKKQNSAKKLKPFIKQEDLRKILNVLKKEKYKLKYNRMKSLSDYKKVLSVQNNANFSNYESNSFFEPFFESLSKYLKYRDSIRLILRPLNKESKKTLIASKNFRLLSQGFLRLYRFKRQDYFIEGLNLILFCVTHVNSTNLLAEFLAIQLRKLKKYVNFFIKFVRKALIVFKHPSYSPVTKGVKIQMKGRFNKAPRAKKKTIKVGKFLPILTLKSKVAYSETTSYTKDGTFGIKVWMVYK